jgi:hypothetical protein
VVVGVGFAYSADRSVAVLEQDEQSQPTGLRLTAWFTRDKRGYPVAVSEVRVALHRELTPTALARFPWRRWMRLALLGAQDRYRQGSSPWAGPDLEEAVVEMFREHPERTEVPKRPGRAGHDPVFYEEIAARYRQLVTRGVKSPTAQLARERHVPRDTASGWIRRCRELGYLPPARPGRAG